MTANTNPISYDGYIDQIGVLAVYQVNDSVDPSEFVDAPINLSVPQMLNYAELRIQRDLDLLPSVSSNNYTLTAGNNILNVPIDDFIVVRTLRIPGQGRPLTPVSREYIQNVYDDGSTPGMPKFFAMIGDNWGDGANTYNNILLGPTPSFAFTMRISGNIRLPSLYIVGQSDPDTGYTYISTYYPDMLLMASMVYISALQRNFSATSDDTEMSMSYEKQYLSLMTVAKMEENRKKQQGSGWSGYSTPTSATATR